MLGSAFAGAGPGQPGRPKRAVLAVLQKVLAPGGPLGPLLEDPLVLERPAVVVVVRFGAEDEQVDQRRAHEDVLNRLERAEPDDIADPAGTVVADGEAPAFLSEIGVPDHLDVSRVTDPEAGLVGEPDVRDAQRIEAHHLGGYGVDGDLVVGPEDD